jgi:hypothetical protein
MLPNSGYEVSAFAQILDTLGLPISTHNMRFSKLS